MAGRHGLRLLASAVGRRMPLACVSRLPHGLQAAADFCSISRSENEPGGRRMLSPFALLCGAAAAAAYACRPALADASAAPAPYLPEQASTSTSSAYEIPTKRRGLPKEVIIYQYEVCPFCCKVKAFLDYHKIPYQTVEVGPIFKSELKKWTKHRKVPVAVLDGEPVADSSAIISRLAAEVGAPPSEQPPADAPTSGGWTQWRRKGQARPVKAQAAAAGGAGDEGANAARQEEERWRRWVDERYVRLLTVNIYRTWRESFQMFDYIADTGRFNLIEREATRLTGAVMMHVISGGLMNSGGMRKKYNISGDVRQELFAAADDWVAALGDRSFMGGDAPNLADLAVFGATRSVTCTDTFNELMHTTSIGPWYARMMGAVGQSSRVSTA